MLNTEQQKVVWESWLSAETRAGYFAELSVRFRSRQRLLTALSVILSSGAGLSLVTTAIPPALIWPKAVLAFLAAILGAITLVSRNESAAFDCADLHLRWNTLAMDYGAMWADMDADDAEDRLRTLQRREAEVSKAGVTQPSKRRLLVKIQKTVMMQHGHPA